MEPTTTATPSDHPAPTGKPERHFPIKGLIIFLVAAQPVLVAISLYYTEVFNKKEPVLCDPGLRAALLEQPIVPTSDYYNDDPAAKAAYEEGWVTGYHRAIKATVDAGCNAPPQKVLPAYASPVGTVETARANGQNDGALAAQALPRECLNDCWRLAIRKPSEPSPIRPQPNR